MHLKDNPVISKKLISLIKQNEMNLGEDLNRTWSTFFVNKGDNFIQ